MPRTVRVAVWFSFLLHGVLILAARYRASYDAYIHMFFADHYRTDWWSLWDTRWYTGFSVTSYPPLVHQLIALLSHGLGLDRAYALVLWITLTLLPLAVYSFARIFVGRASAGYAALGGALLPSVYLTAHIFGQLPFLVGTMLALFGAASLAHYLKDGGSLNFALTLGLSTTTMAAHHAILLMQPFLVFAVVMKLVLTQKAETARRVNSKVSFPHQLISRLALFGACAILLSLLVVFPFWEWGRTQTLQTAIDHASRHNFFQDPLAVVLFFLPMYGPLILIIPAALSLARKPNLIGLGLAFVILFLLGLGGTTPLPRLLFGKGWAWLTYDRFAFWASLALLPFFGMIVILLRRRRGPSIRKKILLSLAISSLVVGLFTLVYPLQPGTVDMKEIVDFLNQADHSHWRYLTFGFGDQLALLSTLTSATTMDGSYHTARTLPELRSSGIAQIDTAFWFPNGLAALDPILQKAGERGVRWGFVNIPQYIPVLEKNGWVKRATLGSGVQVWENPSAVRPEISTPPVDTLASFAWGTFPLLSLIATLSLASLRVYPLQAEKILRSLHASAIALLPLGWSFWYYRMLAAFPHPRVYFTYDHALFFLGDALALLAVIFWLSVQIARQRESKRTPQVPLVVILLGGLFLLATLSALWSADGRTSLYISVHLWIVFLLVLSLHDWNTSWRPLLFGLCAALTMQIITGYVGFALQSTDFLVPLHMKWPGLLSAATPGSSVVQLGTGLRLLRAYGTLPHPNLLGGFTCVTLIGPTGLYLTDRKPNHAALLLLALGLVLLILTFSRSAWLGWLAFVCFLLLRSKHLDRRRLLLWVATSLLTILLAVYPLRSYIFTRLNSSSIPTELISSAGRSWLALQARAVIYEYPILGVGIGSFVIELARNAVAGAPVEPVHNGFLLIGAELGVLGFFITLLLAIAVAAKVVRARASRAIITSAALIGLGVISLFDHYLWSLAPGRLLLGLVLGLWAGQARLNEA